MGYIVAQHWKSNRRAWSLHRVIGGGLAIAALALPVIACSSTSAPAANLDASAPDANLDASAPDPDWSPGPDPSLPDQLETISEGAGARGLHGEPFWAHSAASMRTQTPTRI